MTEERGMETDVTLRGVLGKLGMETDEDVQQ